VVFPKITSPGIQADADIKRGKPAAPSIVQLFNLAIMSSAAGGGQHSQWDGPA